MRLTNCEIYKMHDARTRGFMHQAAYLQHNKPHQLTNLELRDYKYLEENLMVCELTSQKGLPE